MDRHPRHSAFHSQESEPRRLSPMEDMLQIAEVVLGPRFDKKGKALWGLVEDGISASGFAVAGGSDYFVYERGAVSGVMGLKRVRLDEAGRKWVATQAIRSAEEEYQHNRP